MASAERPPPGTESMMDPAMMEDPNAHHPTSFTVAPEDLRTIYYYYAVFAGFIAFFALWYWFRYLALLKGFKSTSTISRVVTAPSRYAKSFASSPAKVKYNF